MRIIAGRWRSRLLASAEGLATRPTASRSRETLFSMLQSRLGSFEELAVLDLFAGSGALALEALSRGAAHACLVENDPAARRAIATNIKRLSANARLVGHDATRLPPAEAPADVIFLDPPYASDLADKALAGLARSGWAASHSWVSVETAASHQLSAPGFTLVAERRVGRAKLWLLRPQGLPAPAETR